MAYKYESVVNVIGHINPDTDSVCSAIAYANLKSQSTGEKYIPKRAGQINAETQFVLKYFGVSAPDYMGDVRTQVIDIDVQRVTGVSQEISLKRAWELMKTDTLQTLPIVDASQKLLGLITIEDIAGVCGLNRTYFGKIFKEALGKTPQEFLLNYRMLKAAELLKLTSLSIGDVGLAVGYANQMHFSRAFKNNYGISPREWRYQNHINNTVDSDEEHTQ